MFEKKCRLCVLALLVLVFVPGVPGVVLADDPLSGRVRTLIGLETLNIYDYTVPWPDAALQLDLDFGDAPEGALAYPATGVLGAFPTCMNIGAASWVQHTNFGAWFGPGVDFEPEGNAGLCPLFTPNAYDMDECFADGDAGLLFPEAYTIQGPVGAEAVVPCPQWAGTPLGASCQVAVWGVDVDIDVTNLMPGGVDGFVNVLVDWDGDGQWGGASTCATPGDTPEHVLVDFPVPNGFMGPLSLLQPPPFVIGPRPGHAWARFTISEYPVGPDWHGEGGFEDGESEDYLLEIESPPPIEVDLSKTLLEPADGIAVISDTLRFQVEVRNTGETEWVSNPFTDAFEDCMSFLEVFQDGMPVPAVGPGSPLTWDMVPINGGPIVPGQVVVIDLWFHADAEGECVNRAEVIEIDRFGQVAEDADDAVVVIVEPYEFGDAPENSLAYPTTGVLGAFPTCINCGPAGWVQHTNFGAWFGPAFDLEPEGNAGLCPLFTPNAYDADECFADGDAGLLFPEAYTIRGPAGAEAVVPCPGFVGTPLGAPCRVAVWGVDVDMDLTNIMPNQTDGFVNVLIDWNGDGQWAGASTCAQPGDAPEHVLVDFPVPNGFSGPLSALGPPPFLIGPRPGFAWARFTISEYPVGPDWHGEGGFEDGESEDYLLEVWAGLGLDFGDAPDPTYPTLLVNNGARHTIDGVTFLGAGVDPEPNGQPDAAATGDDNDGNDDEDGVTFTSAIVRGGTTTVDVTASTPGILNAWLDYNGNGSWAEIGEQIFVDQPLAAGLNNLSFVLPLGATPGTSFARFRFSTMQGLRYDGLAPDGEVEDYMVTIESPPPIEVDLSKTLIEPPGGIAVISDTIRFQVVVTNTGGTAWVTNPFTDTFDPCMNLVAAEQDGVPVPAVGPGSPLTWDFVPINGGPIVPGQVVVIDLFFHANAAGDCVNRAEVLEIDRFGQRATDRDSAVVVIVEPYEFGDAPENSLAYPATGVPGAFPTCINCGPAGWVQHTNFGAWFGPAFDLEPEGNAGLCPLFTPNAYDMDECFADGDAGLLFPESYTIQGPVGGEVVVPCPGFAGTTLGRPCQVAVWGVDVDMDVTNMMPTGAVGFVNVLIDWDGDGQWAGASTCASPGDTPEHVLVDFPVPPGFTGPLSILGPPPFLIGPQIGYAWARFTISEQPVGPDWHGEGSFEDGESEDYMLLINTPPTISGLPDVTVDPTTPLPVTIDLWAYASDNETPDSGLTFTIDGTPPPGAGASIAGNRWLTLNPSTGWCGKVDITVRVTDPGALWDTDTLRLTSTTATKPVAAGNAPVVDMGCLAVDCSAGPGGTVTVTLHTNDYPSPPTGVGTTSGYWDLISDFAAPYTCDLAFAYHEEDLNGAAESDLAGGARWDDGHVQWRYLGGTVDTGANTLTVPGVTTFSPWLLLTDTPPRAIIDLAGTRAGSDLRLSWSLVTQDILGNAVTPDHYVIYRRVNGPYFQHQFVDILTLSATPPYTDHSVLGNTALNYYYVVTAVDSAGVESAPSNRLGAFDFAMTPASSPGQRAYNLIALNLKRPGVVDADSLAAYAGSSVYMVLRHDAPTQAVQWRLPGLAGTNFALQTGEAPYLYLDHTAPSTLSLVGDVPAKGEVRFSLTPGVPAGSCKYNFISVPLHRNDLVDADTLAADIGGVYTIGRYNAATQDLTWRTPGVSGVNFGVNVGYPYIACLDDTAPAEWP